MKFLMLIYQSIYRLLKSIAYFLTHEHWGMIWFVPLMLVFSSGWVGYSSLLFGLAVWYLIYSFGDK